MWIGVHALLAGVFSIWAIAFGAHSWLLLAIAAEGVVAFSWLLIEAGPDRNRPANVITGFRAATALVATALVGVVPSAMAPAYAILFSLLIAGEVSDFFDGFVARRSGTTSFGGRFDAETDAFFMLALALVAVRWFGLPRWVIVAGFLRYGFYFVFLLLPESTASRLPRRFSLFAKSACATAAIMLLVSIGPFIPFAMRIVAAATAVSLLAASFLTEMILRLSSTRVQSAAVGLTGSRIGVLRSVLTYYGVPFRLISARRFYSRFIPAGGLVFDIGAHVGSRIRVFRSLGAKVVALEPQPACVRVLQRWYGDDEAVTILQSACGGKRCSATMHLSSEHPTLSTLSANWIDSIHRHYAKNKIEWDSSIEVDVTTLDDLISEYGQPDFVKIDVEGFEADVLRGLSTVLPALSFEFLPASLDSAFESLDLVAGLGNYKFNYSPVEKMRFASIPWIDCDEMRRTLHGMDPAGRSGDIYAVRADIGR